MPNKISNDNVTIIKTSEITNLRSQITLVLCKIINLNIFFPETKKGSSLLYRVTNTWPENEFFL